jgi:hypothetical protein
MDEPVNQSAQQPAASQPDPIRPAGQPAADRPGVPTEAAQGRALLTGLVIGVIFGGILGGLVGAVVSRLEPRTQPVATQPEPRILAAPEDLPPGPTSTPARP